MNEADFERVIAQTGQENVFDSYEAELIDAQVLFRDRFESRLNELDEDDEDRQAEISAEMDAELAVLNAECHFLGENVNVFGEGRERYWDTERGRLFTRQRTFNGDTFMMAGFAYVVEYDAYEKTRVRLGYKLDDGRRVPLNPRGPLQQEQIALFSFAEIGVAKVNDRFFGAREIEDLRYLYPQLIEQLDQLIDGCANDDEKILSLKNHVIPAELAMTAHERGVLASYVHSRINIDIELPYAIAAEGPMVFEDAERDMQWIGKDETLQQEMNVSLAQRDKPFVAQLTALMIARKPEVDAHDNVMLSKDYHWHLAVDAYGKEYNTGSQEVLLPVSSVAGLSSVRDLA